MIRCRNCLNEKLNVLTSNTIPDFRYIKCMICGITYDINTNRVLKPQELEVEIVPPADVEPAE